MAFCNGLNLNFNLGNLQCSTFPGQAIPHQRQALLTALLSLATLMQQLSHGCASPGMSPSFGMCQGGGPSFGGCQGGPELGSSFDDFLGGSQQPSGGCSPRAGRGGCASGRPETACRRGSVGGREDGARPETAESGRTSAASVSHGDGRDHLGEIDVERLVQALPASRRESARTHFPIIIAEARRQGVPSRAQLAYILATATHESGAGRRMVEIASGEAYEGRRGLGNTEPGDGPRFRGRGYVQLTGRGNYTAWSRRLGMDLVGNPSLAERPEVAARILVGGMCGGTFTRHRLDRYVNDDLIDFNGARRTIGSGRGADRVSAVARQLLAAMS